MEKDHLEIILEDMNGKFDILIESHQTLRNEIKRTREELTDKIEDNSIAIRFLNKKIDSVDDSLNAKIDNFDNSLNAKIDSLDSSLNTKIDKLDSSLNAKIDGLDSSLNTKIDKVNEDLGAKIDAVADDLKHHREDTEIHTNYRVSEGLN